MNNNIENISIDSIHYSVLKLLNNSLSLLIQIDTEKQDYKTLVFEIKSNLGDALKLNLESNENDLISVPFNAANSVLLETDEEVVFALLELLQSSLSKAAGHFESLYGRNANAENTASPEVYKEGEFEKNAGSFLGDPFDFKEEDSLSKNKKAAAAVQQHSSTKADPGPAQEPARDNAAEREVLLTFIDECAEHLLASEDALLRLESDPADMQAVNNIFRAFHTIKGSAHFLNFKHVSALAHEAENFLSKIREGETRCCKKCLELAFSALDELKFLIDSIKTGDYNAAGKNYNLVIEALKKGVTGDDAPEANPAVLPLKNIIDELDRMASVLAGAGPDDIKVFTSLKKSLDSLAKSCPDEIAASIFDAASSQLNELITTSADDSLRIISVVCAMVESCITHLESQIRPAQKKSAAVSSAQSAQAPPAPVKVKKTEPEVKAAPAVTIDVSFEFDAESIDREMFLTFIDECLEHIQASEEALLNLENNVEDSSSINTVFRAFHTVKGSSSFLGLAGVSELAHHAESLLVKIRDKEISYGKNFADICLRSVDMLKTLITSLKAGNYKKPDNYDDLLRLLMSPELKKGIIPAAYADKKIESPKAEKIERPAPEPLKPVISYEEKTQAPAAGAPENKMSVAAPEAKKVVASISDEEESTVRVKIARIDKLIDMVGELVISHSMVAQDDAMVNGANHILAKKVMQSGKIIRELQDLSMTMRMIPFRATFQKMARVVRDISSKNGKQIDFITSGKETEVDRNLVDIINDALMHMVRNAVDHGIEPSEDRKKAGKPEKGTVILSAFHSGGNVVIEVKDDGKGLDRPKIVKKAVEKGLIKSDENMSDSDVFNLVFLPGFSTADQITDISGRGVGMDVVKTSIESLRGRIDISSIPGNGCCFSIKVPLTLAVTDGMLIKVGSQRYIIPTANIYLTFRPKIEDIFTMAGRGEMVMLHGKMIPVFRLNKIFNISHSIENPWESLFVVIDDGDNKHCAILVDELLGQQQIVAKPLGVALGKIEGVSGGAILGDGKVGLIIDTKEIVNIARQTASVKAKQIA